MSHSVGVRVQSLSHSCILLAEISFYVNLPLGGLVATAIVLLRLSRKTDKPGPWSVIPKLRHHLDPIGFILFAPATFQLLLALQFSSVNYP